MDLPMDEVTSLLEWTMRRRKEELEAIFGKR